MKISTSTKRTRRRVFNRVFDYFSNELGDDATHIDAYTAISDYLDCSPHSVKEWRSQRGTVPCGKNWEALQILDSEIRADTLKVKRSKRAGKARATNGAAPVEDRSPAQRPEDSGDGELNRVLKSRVEKMSVSEFAEFVKLLSG